MVVPTDNRSNSEELREVEEHTRGYARHHNKAVKGGGGLAGGKAQFTRYVSKEYANPSLGRTVFVEELERPAGLLQLFGRHAEHHVVVLLLHARHSGASKESAFRHCC